MDKKTVNFLKKYLHNDKGTMTLSIMLSVLSVMAGFIPYFVVYRFMTGFVSHSIVGRKVMILGIICAAGYFLKALLFELSTTLSHHTAYSVLEKIRNDLSSKFMKMPLGYVVDQPIGKLKNLVIDQVETMELPLAHLIPEGTAYILAPIGVFVILLWIHPLMAVASIVSVVAGMFLAAPMMSGMNKNYDAYMASSNSMNSTIVEYLEGIEVIKTFNQGEASYGKFTKSIEDFRTLTLKWFRSTWVSGNLMMTVMPSTLLGVLPIGLFLYMRGSFSPEELVFSIVLSMALISPVMGLSTYMNSLKMIQYAAQSLDEVLEQPEIQECEKEVPLDKYDLCFDHVSFSYHDTDKKKILNDLSFEVKEGSFVALVGPSGGGKSTVAKLISRFWDIKEGKITIGGVDIRRIPLSFLSHYISYVAQENYLLNTSIMENIRLGDPNASDEEVYAAAKLACCHEFIIEMEHGYDTAAGEAGNRLSGGEKQRIAIARMILRNAPIVILDEATAYTDPENEEKIQQAISNLTKGKTLLVIAHRLSTIKNADQIMVLSDGKICESGTHEQLLGRSTIYKEMWNAHIGAKNQAVEGGK